MRRDHQPARLRFSGSGLPAFAALTDRGDGTATLQAAPDFNQAGSYRFTVAVSDGTLNALVTLPIVVRNTQ